MNHQELIEQLRKGFGTAAGRATQVNFYHMWCQKAADAIESLLNALDVADSEVKRTAAERDAALAELAKYRDAPKYGCHCDLEDHMEPDGCVIDEGDFGSCVYAKRYGSKEECKYWQPILIVKPGEQ